MADRVPLSTSFGRRPVYLASLLICFGSAIWRAKAQTYGSFMGACVLNGIAAGPAETIQPNVIADVMFLHERGTYQTLYFAFYFGSLMVCLFTLVCICHVHEYYRLDLSSPVRWRSSRDGATFGGSMLV